MHSQVANHEALNKQKPRWCNCKVDLRQIQRRKYKRKNEARNQLENKKGFEGLIAENSYLKEIVEKFIADYLHIPATQKQEISIHVKDEQGMASGLEGNDEELDGLELDDLLNDMLPNEVTDPNTSLILQQNAMAEFLMKIDEDVASNVDFPDFMIYFNGEQKTIGRYNFPLSLVPTVERIINVYGDVSASSSMANMTVTRNVYLLLCATIKEMGDLKLHQVTEKKMLQWRDAIKDALRINFNVEFAMSHLKKIARAYFGCIGDQVLKTIDDKLDALYKERAEVVEGFKDCMADAMDFHGQSVSTGLFP